MLIITILKTLNKERYKEEYQEGSDLLWSIDNEDKVTRKFYRDLSLLTKKEKSNNKKRLNFLNSIINNKICKNLKIKFLLN